MLLDHVGQCELGAKLDAAVRSVISSGNTTGDLGGSLNTEQFTKAVVLEMG